MPRRLYGIFKVHSQSAEFIDGRSKSQPSRTLPDGDTAHFIVLSIESHQSAGLLILYGPGNPNSSPELRKIVISDKGYAFGRAIQIQERRNLLSER